MTSQNLPTLVRQTPPFAPAPQVRPPRMIAAALVLIALSLPMAVFAQGGRGGRGGPPPTAKAAAPFDITGYWTSIVTEDWHVRMITAAKGDFGSGPDSEGLPFGGGGNIPYNAEGTKLGKSWDLAKDKADGNVCKSFGGGGIMRQPSHVHITWDDDYTLKMEFDNGTQTRILKFAKPAAQGGALTKPAPSAQPSAQGDSVAEWIIKGGTPAWPRGGNLQVITANMTPGYYWKNGMPYSDKTTLTEHMRVLKEDNGDEWLNFSLMAEDPTYLREPWISTYHFKKLPDGLKYKPRPCAID